MGFFTDSEKNENQFENQSFPENFSGFNVAFNKTSTSLTKSCKTDPQDKNYLLCKIIEKKVKNINGEDKIITEEREEREPINNNFMIFDFTIPSFFNSFNQNNNNDKKNNGKLFFDEENDFINLPDLFSDLNKKNGFFQKFFNGFFPFFESNFKEDFNNNDANFYTNHHSENNKRKKQKEENNYKYRFPNNNKDDSDILDL